MIVSVDIPHDIYNRASAIARSQELSVADVIATACVEHVRNWDRLASRAKQGDRERFLEVLAKVPDAEPDERDRFGSPICGA